MSELENHRKELVSITDQILNLISERREVVSKLQKSKNTSGEFAFFDLERELIVFKNIKDKLKTFSKRELLAISLLIESQADINDQYPSWSMRIHLEKYSQTIEEMINPILLAHVDKNSYDSLQFNTKFKEILYPISEK